MLPDLDDEAEARRVFGDFELDAATPMEGLCTFYGLPVPVGSQQSLGDWMRETLGRPPVIGDSVPLGHAELSVRRLDSQGHIARVGMRID